ncbi:MAG: hypothetical protein ACRYE7_02480 [Janthinobacterium lividum]
MPITRTPFNVWDYAGKDGDVVACNADRPPAKGNGASKDDHWAGSFHAADKNAFFVDVKAHSPRDWVLYRKQIRHSAEEDFGTDTITPDQVDVSATGLYIHWERYPSAREWVLDNIPNAIERIRSTSRGDSYPPALEAADTDRLRLRGLRRPARPKSLLITGETRLGKTDFARGLGKHINFHATTDIERLMTMRMEEIEYAVFDDVHWRDGCLKNGRFKNWAGGQGHFTTTDKYFKKATISWAKPSIFCINNDPREDGLTERDYQWLINNCTIIDVGSFTPDRQSAISSADIHDEF